MDGGGFKAERLAGAGPLGASRFGIDFESIRIVGECGECSFLYFPLQNLRACSKLEIHCLSSNQNTFMVL